MAPTHETDLEGRRTALSYLALVGTGALAWRAQILTNRVLTTAGAERRFTGSREEGSDAGNVFPVTSWVANDPDPIDIEEWTLRVGGAVEREVRWGPNRSLPPSETGGTYAPTRVTAASGSTVRGATNCARPSIVPAASTQNTSGVASASAIYSTPSARPTTHAGCVSGRSRSIGGACRSRRHGRPCWQRTSATNGSLTATAHTPPAGRGRPARVPVGEVGHGGRTPGRAGFRPVARDLRERVRPDVRASPVGTANGNVRRWTMNHRPSDPQSGRGPLWRK